MKLSGYIASFLFLFSSFAYPEETKEGFRVIEDKATLPLLNPSMAARKIAKIELANGLQALLISDPAAQQSAAALSVEAGSWEDPADYPGMAHFLEHMLFMGNEAYPKEFEYMQYISDNGGSVNAYTASDKTVYMFSINNEAFEGATDRFSHFFIDPLFLPSCIGRELHAVDQEHSKNIEHDGWREYMIFKETGNKEHPITAFSTGNAKTLSGIPQSALKKWYEEHYSANRMHLVMMSPLPLDQLKELALECFSKVPNHSVALKIPSSSMTSEEQLGHIIYIKPIRDLKKVSLQWEVPREFAADMEKRAPQLVSYVLMSRDDKSLLEVLKKEKLAEDLSVSLDRYSKEHALFQIEVELTAQGVTQIDTVIFRCFQAISRLKETGIPAYIFDEIKNLATIDYEYQSREDAFKTVTEHASSMVYEDLATYPEKSLIPSTYDPKFISSFIRTLTPESCLVFVQADPDKVGVQTNLREKWMNAEYAVREIPQEKLLALNNAPINSQIDLPPPNPFVPDRLELVGPVEEPGVLPIPIVLADEPAGKIYFAQDKKYFVPEMAGIFTFKTPYVDGSVKKIVLIDLYLKALTEKMSSTLFFANTAGLNANFSHENIKFTISVAGYSQKAAPFIKTIFEQLKNLSITPDQFEIYKLSRLSAYDNASKELPVQQAGEILSNIMYDDSPTCSDKYKALKSISYEEFIQFARAVFKTNYIEGVIYGNLLKADAAQLWTGVKELLASSPYPAAQHFRRHVLTLPEKHGPFLIRHTTERQGNGIILVVEEGAFSFEKKASQQLLSKALREAFFDTLRTKQQTAYIAKTWDVEVERQLFQFFAVQSNSHHPQDLLSRFELFLEDFNRNFQERMPPDRFEKVRDMLIITLKKPPENLPLMANRLNMLAFTYDGNFKWIDQYIDAVAKITYEQLAQDTDTFLSRQNSKRLAVFMEGIVPAENDFRYEHVSKQDIRDLGTYVSWK